MSFFGGSAAAPAGNNANDPKDVEVADPPPDSISSISFSPVADFLAVGSWDNNVRIYEVGANGQTQGKAMYQHQAPVLSTCWSKDGTKLLSGGCDNAVRLFDISTGQSSQVAQHDGPIKVVRSIETPQGSIIATGSWDKTLKYWDLRSPQPISSVNLPDRVYTMDVVYPLLVVGTAERHIQIFNLTNPTQPFKTMMSPLKWQTRVISCFPAANGFAVGSVEGRVAIQYVEDKDSQNNFSFKCHRKDSTPNTKDQSLVFAVNDITFHPQQGTFSTCGSDGTINFWDKDARTRLKSFEPCPGPVTSTAFNHTGSIFAYSCAYDWSKGHSGMTAGHVNKIFLHPVKDDEVKKRPARK